MLSTDKAWEKFGSEDPYFGVLAEERFTSEKIGENRDAFFESGRATIAHILGRYEGRFGSLPRGRALDHGCGVGRLALPLAEEFAEVVGLDVSPSMLAEAEANARDAGADNVRFALADDALSNAPGEYDFVNSYMVLAAYSGAPGPADHRPAGRQGEAGRRLSRPFLDPHRPPALPRLVVGEPPHPRRQDLAERLRRAALERAGDADE